MSQSGDHRLFGYLTCAALVVSAVESAHAQPAQAPGSQSADAWLKSCVANYETWTRRPPAIDLGDLCRQAFAFGPTDAARIAEIRRRDASERALLDLYAQFGREHSRPAALPSAVAAPPKLVSAPEISRYYPKAALKAGETGRATASCVLDATGRPRNCQIAESSGFADLDAATIRVAEDCLYDAQGRTEQIRVPVHWVVD